MEDKYKLLKTRCRAIWRREQDRGLSKMNLNGNKMADVKMDGNKMADVNQKGWNQDGGLQKVRKTFFKWGNNV